MKRKSLLTLIFIFSLVFHNEVKAQKARFSDKKSIENQFTKSLSPIIIDDEQYLSFDYLMGPDYGRFHSVVFSPASQGVVFASNMDGRQIFRSDDSGSTWSHFYSAPQVPFWGTEIRSLRFANPSEPNHLYFIITSGSEQDVESRGLYIIDITTGDLVKEVKIFHHHHINFHSYDVCPSDPNSMVFVSYMGWTYPGSERTVWITHDGGETFDLIYDWELYNMHAPEIARFHPENNQLIVMGMSNGWYESVGGFYRTTDGGQTWALINEGEVIGDISFVLNDSDKVYAISGFSNEQPRLMRSEDAGLNWGEVEIDADMAEGWFNCFITLTINPQNSNNIWITHESNILVTNDGGVSWEVSSFDYSDNSYYFGFSLALNPFDSNHTIIATDHRVVESHDLGQTWEVMPSKLMSINAVNATTFPDNNKYLYYTAQGSYFAQNLESGEISGEVALDMWGLYYYIFGDRYTQDRAFLAQPGGFFGSITIYQSDDQFATEPVVVYTDSEAGMLRSIVRSPHDENTYWLVTPYWDMDGPAKLIRTIDGFNSTESLSITRDEEIITALEVVELRPGELWAYAYSEEIAGVFKSIDYGTTWEPRSNGLPNEAGIWSIAVNQNNPNNIIASVSLGYGIYVTFDGGENWAPAFNDFECTQVFFSRQHPGIAFAKPFIYPGLAYSFNGGKTWHKVSESDIIDADYGMMDIIEDENEVNIYFSTQGMGIAKYTFDVPEKASVSFTIMDSMYENITDASIVFDGVQYEPGYYTFDNLYPDIYSYEVKRAGFYTFENTVEVGSQGGIQEVLVVLYEKSPDVIFNVDMSLAEGFNPEIHEVYISGNFIEGLNWPIPGTLPGLTLQRIDESMIYSAIYEIVPGTYEYKYYSTAFGSGFNGGEWLEEESRVIVVGDEDMQVNDDWGIEPLVGSPVLNDVSLTLFPNPAKTIVNILSNERISEVKLLNVVGQTIFISRYQGPDTTVDISSYENGVYVLQILTESGKVASKRLLIAK